MSLIIGAGIGWAVAAGMSLDLFHAILRTSTDWKGTLLWGHIDLRPGVLFTGLVIGLGANPTHEVVGMLKQIKQSRKNS